MCKVLCSHKFWFLSISVLFLPKVAVFNWVLSLKPLSTSWKKFLKQRLIFWCWFVFSDFTFPLSSWHDGVKISVLGGWAGGGLASALFPPKLRFEVICYWCARFKSLFLAIWKIGLFPRNLQNPSWRLCCAFPHSFLWLHSTFLTLLWMGGWGKGRCTWCPGKGNVFLLLPRQMSGKAKTQ